MTSCLILQTQSTAAPLPFLPGEAEKSCSYWEQTSNTTALEQLGHKRAFSSVVRHWCCLSIFSETFLLPQACDKHPRLGSASFWSFLVVCLYTPLQTKTVLLTVCCILFLSAIHPTTADWRRRFTKYCTKH